MPITLRDIRELNAGYDESTGIRTVYDALGNPILINPTETIESPERPGQPLTIPKEEARGYSYEGALPGEPETRTIVDEGGNVVDLTETDIRPYLFDPTLIEREADLAMVSTPYGIPTEGEDRFTGRPRASIGEELEEEPIGGIRPEVQAASQRIQQRAGITPPGAEPTGQVPGPVDYLDPQSRTNFQDFIFNKMGGDPRGLNAQEEVMRIVTPDVAQQMYLDRWQPGMKAYGDLSENEKSELEKGIRTEILPEVKAEIEGKQDAYFNAMKDFEMREKAHVDAYKRQQEIRKRDLATVSKERKEKQATVQREDQMRRNMARSLKTLSDNIEKIERLKDSGEPKAMTQISKLEEANSQLQASIDAANEQLGKSKPEGAEKKAPKGKLKPTGEARATAEGAVAITARAAPQGEKTLPDWAPKEAVEAVEIASDSFDNSGNKVPAGKYWKDADGKLNKLEE